MCKEGYGCNVSITNKLCWILLLSKLDCISCHPSLVHNRQTSQSRGGVYSCLLTVEGSVTSSFNFYKWCQSTMVAWAKHFISAKWQDPQRRSPERRQSLHCKQRWGCSLTSTEMHVCSKPMRKHTLTAKSKRDSLKNLHSRTLLRLTATEMPWLVPKSNTAKLFSSKGRM